MEYSVTYYDYYQPEAYVPSKDAYIEKDSSVNDEIDKLRHSATAAIAERRDVIIVASACPVFILSVIPKNITVNGCFHSETGMEKITGTVW